MLALATLICLAASLLVKAPASAVIPDIAGTPHAQLQAFCLTKLPAAFKAQACDPSVAANFLVDAVNVATWDPTCIAADGATTNAKTACIEAAAEAFIADAASPAPSSLAAFRTALSRILDRRVTTLGGSASRTTAEPSSLTGAAPTVAGCATAPGGCPSGAGTTCGGQPCEVPDSPDPAACATQPTLSGCSGNAQADCSKNNCDFVLKYLNPAINLFTIVFGVLVAISLILAGIQYASSSGEPQKAAAAKSRISKTIMAFVAYAFLYVFADFLIPGGAFK